MDFGLSRLTSLQFILCHVAGFYKPTIPQSPPSHLRDYSTCNNARLEFSTIFIPSFDPNERCLINGLLSGGLNPWPKKKFISWCLCLLIRTRFVPTVFCHCFIVLSELCFSREMNLFTIDHVCLKVRLKIYCLAAFLDFYLLYFPIILLFVCFSPDQSLFNFHSFNCFVFSDLLANFFNECKKYRPSGFL